MRSHMIHVYHNDNSDLKNNNEAYMKKPPLPMKGSKYEPMLGTHDDQSVRETVFFTLSQVLSHRASVFMPVIFTIVASGTVSNCLNDMSVLVGIQSADLRRVSK